MIIKIICPICGDLVSARDKTADFIVSGRGRFATKQLYHHKCVEGRKKNDGIKEANGKV